MTAIDTNACWQPCRRHRGTVTAHAHGVHAWFGDHHVLADVNLDMTPLEVTALIGPSGCGKSTFLRLLNRMHELVPSASLAGQIELDGVDIYRGALSATDGSPPDRDGVPKAQPVPCHEPRPECAGRGQAGPGSSSPTATRP